MLNDVESHHGERLDALAEAIRLELRQGHEAARALLHQIAIQYADWDDPWLRIGQSLRQEGRFAEACTAYDAGLARNPHRIEALLARGVLALQNEGPQESIQYLRRATEIDPAQHQAWHALACAFAALAFPDAAGNAITRACILEPGNLVYAFHHAEILQSDENACSAPSPEWPEAVRLALAGRNAAKRGRLGEAADALEAAVALKPNDPQLLKMLAAIYLGETRPDLAEPLLHKAHDLAPDDTSIINDWAVALGRLYRFGEAEAVMGKLPKNQAVPATMLFNRATLRAAIGDFDGSRDDITQARDDADPRAALRTECTLLPYRSGIDAMALREAMARLGASLPCGDGPAMRNRPATLCDQDGMLRIGLLSNTLRQHPVGWLTLAGLEMLDKAAFSLHCFGHFEPRDGFAADFARHVRSWHSIDGLDDRGVAERIGQENIDILIDLGGFGDGGRLGVLAHRAAPVQMKWVGSQASTTGVPAVDWFITDRWETPDGFDHFYTERLLRLADGYVCYRPPPESPAVSLLPALGNGHVTFGCFNNLAKFTDETLRLWARLLERLPGARLSLRCPQFSEPPVLERFPQRAARHGLDPARLELRGRAPHPVFIAGYREIDIALDPVPYSGGLTTCEALYMGVPVITLAGDFFAARHSVSHISNVGVVGCIADTADDYVERALAMASDLPTLAALRAELRWRVLASPLCDATRFGRSLGEALRSTWHEHCRRAMDIA